MVNIEWVLDGSFPRRKLKLPKTNNESKNVRSRIDNKMCRKLAGRIKTKFKEKLIIDLIYIEDGEWYRKTDCD